jgi:protein SCO1
MNKTRNLLIGALAFLVIAVMLVFVSGLWPGGGPPGIAIGGPFKLEGPAGQTVTDQTYKDKWQLIYFGYTLCPDACPTTLNEIAGAMEKLGPLAARVQPIFITVDPERDTPKLMGDYVKAFDARIVGLTGSPEAIAAAAREFRVYYKKVQEKDAPGGYLMDHSSVIYVMRPGDVRFVANFTTDNSADQMAERLKRLIGNS